MMVLPVAPAITALCFHSLLLLVVSITKPYFNHLEKLRAIFTFSLLVLADITFIMAKESILLPLIFMGLLSIHIIYSMVITVMSFRRQIFLKCNPREKIARGIFEKQMN